MSLLPSLYVMKRGNGLTHKIIKFSATHTPALVNGTLCPKNQIIVIFLLIENNFAIINR